MKHAFLILTVILIAIFSVMTRPGPEIVYEAPKKIRTFIVAEISAYTASKDETDERPWEMASGRTVYMGAIACPGRIPFGTKVLIGGKVFVCEDRMAKKYRDKDHFDIFVSTKAEAFEFGRQKLQVTIIQ